MRSAENGNGYQAWQALLRARTARNATNLLNMLLEPIFTSPDPRINLRQWNKNTEEYPTRTGERVSDGIRRAVYMNKIAPQDMRQHFNVESSPYLTLLKTLPRKLKITGMQPRSSHVMRRTKLDLLLQLAKVL